MGFDVANASAAADNWGAVVVVVEVATVCLGARTARVLKICGAVDVEVLGADA